MEKLKVANSVSIRCKYPWILRDGESSQHSGDSYVHGLNQTIRASPSYHGRPVYSFVEFLHSGLTRYGQVRLTFEQLFEDKLGTSGQILILIHLLKQSDFRVVCSNTWELNCREILHTEKCFYFQWSLIESTNYEHVVTSLLDILRPVCMEPDLSKEFSCEPGSSHWKGQFMKAICLDVKRCKKHKLVYDQQQSDLGANSQVQRPRPAMSLSDDFVLTEKKEKHIFFLIDFIPWTRPSL